MIFCVERITCDFTLQIQNRLKKMQLATQNNLPLSKRSHSNVMSEYVSLVDWHRHVCSIGWDIRYSCRSQWSPTFRVHYERNNWFITACQRSCGKVMFSQACICPQGWDRVSLTPGLFRGLGMPGSRSFPGGVCISSPMCYPDGRYAWYTPWKVHSPCWHLAWKWTVLYASYWNSFLVLTCQWKQ